MKSIAIAGLLLLASQIATGEAFESLTGIAPEMSVYVQPWQEGCPASLEPENLAREATERLRAAKIEVLDRHPATIRVEVTCLEVEAIDARAVSVTVQFWQPVRGKINDWNGSAPTWRAEELLHAFGTERDAQGQTIRAAVSDLVDDFVRDYRQANSGKSPAR